MARVERPPYSKFPLDLYDAGKALTGAQRAKFYAGVLSLFFEGEEPEGLPRPAASLLSAFRDRVLRARGRALRAKGPEEAPEDSPEADKNPSGTELGRGEYVDSPTSESGPLPAPDGEPLEGDGTNYNLPNHESIKKKSINHHQPNSQTVAAPPEREPKHIAVAMSGAITAISEKREQAYEPTAASDPPKLATVMAYANQEGLTHLMASKNAAEFIRQCEESGWRDGDGRPIRSWKKYARGYEKARRWSPAEDMAAYDFADAPRISMVTGRPVEEGVPPLIWGDGKSDDPPESDA